MVKTERPIPESMESTTLAELGDALPSINSQETLYRQRSKLEECLSACKKERHAMCKARDTPTKQRNYLMKRVSRFQRLAFAAVEGRYCVDRLFITRPEYRLVSMISDFNENFRSGMRKRGHTYYFESEKHDGKFDSAAQDLIQDVQGLREWAASCNEISKFLELPGSEEEEVTALAKPQDGIMSYLAKVISELPRVGKQSTVSIKPSFLGDSVDGLTSL